MFRTVLLICPWPLTALPRKLFMLSLPSHQHLPGVKPGWKPVTGTAVCSDKVPENVLSCFTQHACTAKFCSVVAVVRNHSLLRLQQELAPRLYAMLGALRAVPLYDFYKKRGGGRKRTSSLWILEAVADQANPCWLCSSRELSEGWCAAGGPSCSVEPQERRNPIRPSSSKLAKWHRKAFCVY